MSRSAQRTQPDRHRFGGVVRRQRACRIAGLRSSEKPARASARSVRPSTRNQVEHFLCSGGPTFPKSTTRGTGSRSTLLLVAFAIGSDWGAHVRNRFHSRRTG